MGIFNSELIEHTVKTINDTYLSGNCCDHICDHLRYMVREASRIDRSVNLVTIEDMEQWLTKQIPNSCKEYPRVIKFVIEQLKKSNICF